MRRAIVHIGLPRTGSTTFQHILYHLRPNLKAAGILYPDLTPRSALLAPHINHQHLGETLDGRRPPHEREELLHELSIALDTSECEIVLLSYESLIQQNRRCRTPEILSALFARHGFAMESLVVVKPQSEYLNSIYTHRIQFMRDSRDFAHFARAYERSGRFAYDRLIRPWIASCEGRVRAVPVRDQRSTAPLVLRLLSELKIEASVAPLLQPGDLQRIENRSPGPVAVEVSRRLRTELMQLRLRVNQREMTQFVEQTVIERGLDSVSFRGVNEDIRARMDARYLAANDRFARAIWARPWAEVVAPEATRDVNELAIRAIDPATELVIEEILQQACQQFKVAPSRSKMNRPINLLVDGIELLRQWLHIH